MDPEVTVSSILDYYWGLRILANANARAGNYSVKSKAAPVEVTMAPLSVNMDYADFALRATVDSGLHASGAPPGLRRDAPRRQARWWCT